jgi:hypothetical protein
MEATTQTPVIAITSDLKDLSLISMEDFEVSGFDLHTTSLDVGRTYWFDNSWKNNSWKKMMERPGGGYSCFWTRDVYGGDEFAQTFDEYDTQFPSKSYMVLNSVNTLETVKEMFKRFLHENFGQEKHVWIQGTLEGKSTSQVLAMLQGVKRDHVYHDVFSDINVERYWLPAPPDKPNGSSLSDYHGGMLPHRISIVPWKVSTLGMRHHTVGSPQIFPSSRLFPRSILKTSLPTTQGGNHSLNVLYKNYSNLVRIRHARNLGDDFYWWRPIEMMGSKDPNAYTMINGDLVSIFPFKVSVLDDIENIPSIGQGDVYIGHFKDPESVGATIVDTTLPAVYPEWDVHPAYRGISSAGIYHITDEHEMSKYVVLTRDGLYATQQINKAVKALTPVAEVSNRGFFMGLGSVVTSQHSVLGVGRSPNELLKQYVRKQTRTHDGGTSGHMMAAAMAHTAHFLWYLEEIRVNRMTKTTVYTLHFDEPEGGVYHTDEEYKNAIDDLEKSLNNHPTSYGFYHLRLLRLLYK